jgi:hypothetical protein
MTRYFAIGHLSALVYPLGEHASIIGAQTAMERLGPDPQLATIFGEAQLRAIRRGIDQQLGKDTP